MTIGEKGADSPLVQRGRELLLRGHISIPAEFMIALQNDILAWLEDILVEAVANDLPPPFASEDVVELVDVLKTWVEQGHEVLRSDGIISH